MLFRYWSLLQTYTLQELVDLMVQRHELFASTPELVALFTKYKISTALVTNSVRELNRPVFSKHGLDDLPVICNRLVFDAQDFLGLRYVHNPVEMIKKGLVVDRSAVLKKRPIVALGDELADIPMADAVLRHGGFVITVGSKSRLTHYCNTHYRPEQFVVVADNDFGPVLHLIEAQLESRLRP